MHTIGRNECLSLLDLQTRRSKLSAAMRVAYDTRFTLAQVLGVRTDQLPDVVIESLNNAFMHLQSQLLNIDDEIAAARANLRNALDTRND